MEKCQKHGYDKEPRFIAIGWGEVVTFVCPECGKEGNNTNKARLQKKEKCPKHNSSNKVSEDGSSKEIHFMYLNFPELFL